MSIYKTFRLKGSIIDSIFQKYIITTLQRRLLKFTDTFLGVCNLRESSDYRLRTYRSTLRSLIGRCCFDLLLRAVNLNSPFTVFTQNKSSCIFALQHRRWVQNKTITFCLDFVVVVVVVSLFSCLRKKKLTKYNEVNFICYK